jgi:hypothetical protein
MTIPAITMSGTCPTFYFIPITRELSDAVSEGGVPVLTTRYLKCDTLATYAEHGEPGMEHRKYRGLVFRCLLAFKEQAKGPWDQMLKRD